MTRNTGRAQCAHTADPCNKASGSRSSTVRVRTVVFSRGCVVRESRLAAAGKSLWIAWRTCCSDMPKRAWRKPSMGVVAGRGAGGAPRAGGGGGGLGGGRGGAGGGGPPCVRRMGKGGGGEKGWSLVGAVSLKKKQQ